MLLFLTILNITHNIFTIHNILLCIIKYSFHLVTHRIAHCAVSRALLVDRWAVRRVNRRVGYGTVRNGTVRQGYLRTLQTFVDILHSFRLVFILFYNPETE